MPLHERCYSRKHSEWISVTYVVSDCFEESKDSHKQEYCTKSFCKAVVVLPDPVQRQILWMMGISFIKINNIHGHKIKIKQLQGHSMSEDFGFWGPQAGKRLLSLIYLFSDTS